MSLTPLEESPFNPEKRYMGKEGDQNSNVSSYVQGSVKENYLEQAFELCIPRFVEGMLSAAECSDHLYAALILTEIEVERILSERTRLKKTKRLLYELLKKRKLQTLHGILNNSDVREDYLKEEVDRVNTDLSYKTAPSFDTFSAELSECRMKIAEAILFEEDEWRLKILEAYLLSKFEIRYEFLDDLQHLKILKDRQKRQMIARLKDPECVPAKDLLQILRQEENGALFSLLTYITLYNIIPRFWEELKEEYDYYIRSVQEKRLVGTGNLDFKVHLRLKKWDALFNVDRVQSDPAAVEAARNLFAQFDAVLQDILPGCVTFRLQFKSLKGLLRCWLEYLDGNLGDKLSNWAEQVMNEKMSAEQRDLKLVNIEINDTFLEAIRELIVTEQESASGQGGITKTYVETTVGYLRRYLEECSAIHREEDAANSRVLEDVAYLGNMVREKTELNKLSSFCRELLSGIRLAEDTKPETTNQDLSIGTRKPLLERESKSCHFGEHYKDEGYGEDPQPEASFEVLSIRKGNVLTNRGKRSYRLGRQYKDEVKLVPAVLNGNVEKRTTRRCVIS